MDVNVAIAWMYEFKRDHGIETLRVKSSEYWVNVYVLSLYNICKQHWDNSHDLKEPNYMPSMGRNLTERCEQYILRFSWSKKIITSWPILAMRCALCVADLRTDGLTAKSSYRDASAHLKIGTMKCKQWNVGGFSTKIHADVTLRWRQMSYAQTYIEDSICTASAWPVA